MQTITTIPAKSHHRTMPRTDGERQPGDTGEHIAFRLQVTLDLERMIGIFREEASRLLGGATLRYTDPDGEEVGDMPKGLHRCSYELKLMELRLGDLTVGRPRRFTGEELEAFERLLGGLLFPLRNALQYRDALRAAHRDPLTGLGNRAALDDALAAEAERSRRNGDPASLLMIDIDHFKQINDRYGHLAGDRVLIAVARVLNEAKRGGDRLFRFGGEEFAMLLPETSLQDSAVVAERLRARVEALVVDCDGHRIDATASFGAAGLRTTRDTVQLLRDADLALYRAKRMGRNCVCLELADALSRQPMTA